MKEIERKKLEQLLKNSLPMVGVQASGGAGRDLWPLMVRRLATRGPGMSWLDWVLLATVATWLAFFPGAIPVLLYHL